MPGERKALIIAWAFPPAMAIGAVRVSKFARYLREFGWDTRVIAAAPGSLPFAATLPLEIPAADVRYVSYFDPLARSERRSLARRVQAGDPAVAGGAAEESRRSLWRSALRTVGRAALGTVPLSQVRLPDRSTPWYRPATRAAVALVNEWRPDVVLSSHGPPGPHIVASRIVRRFAIPWVADFRDPWSGNHGTPYPAPLERLERALERRILRPAAALTTVSDQLAAHLQAIHGKQVVTVFNGFEEDDYAGPVSPADRFVITYTGIAEAPHRDPAPIFEAVALLRRQLAAGAALPELHFVGPTLPSYLTGVAARYGVADLLRVQPSVTLRESVRLQRTSTVLLAINWAGQAIGVLGGKFAEYLATGRPILAVGPHDPAVSNLLERTRAGVWCEAPDAAADVLQGWMEEWQRSGRLDLAPDRDFIAGLSRRAQTGRLAQLLDEVTGSRPR